MSVFRKYLDLYQNLIRSTQKIWATINFAKDIPIDESFTIKFNENGGPFLYCEKLIKYVFQQILDENNWAIKWLLLKKTQENLKILVENYQQCQKRTFSSPCEYQFDISSLYFLNQIAEKKLTELPKNFIVFATTSQIIQTTGDA